MSKYKFFLSFIFVCGIIVRANAQLSKTIDEIEIQHKECLRLKPDSSGCSRTYFAQIDSMLPVVFETLKTQLTSNDKTSLIQEQLSWVKKKGEFFKIQDDTFRYNLQEGIWKKEMIRITYQQKAEYVLKRIKSLMKRMASQ